MFWLTMGILIALYTLSYIIVARLSIRLNGSQLCLGCSHFSQIVISCALVVENQENYI